MVQKKLFFSGNTAITNILCSYVAITDHNNFQSVGVLKEMTDELPHKIAGIELSTKHNGKKLHLLGYFNVNSDFDSEKFAPLRALLDREAESKSVQVRQLTSKSTERLSIICLT